MENKVKLIKQRIKRTDWQWNSFQTKSKVSEDILYNIIVGRTYLSKQNYNKIYKAMDKKIQNDIDILTEFGLKD